MYALPFNIRRLSCHQLSQGAAQALVSPVELEISVDQWIPLYGHDWVATGPQMRPAAIGQLYLAQRVILTEGGFERLDWPERPDGKLGEPWGWTPGTLAKRCGFNGYAHMWATYARYAARTGNELHGMLYAWSMISGSGHHV